MQTAWSNSFKVKEYKSVKITQDPMRYFRIIKAKDFLLVNTPDHSKCPTCTTETIAY